MAPRASWYYEHSAACRCVECTKRQRIEQEAWQEQADKEVRREEHQHRIKKTLKAIIPILLLVYLALGFIGIEPCSTHLATAKAGAVGLWAVIVDRFQQPSVAPSDQTNIITPADPKPELGVSLELARLVHTAVNEERTNFGINTLGWADDLENLAIEHSTNMALTDHFDHERLGWRDFSFGMPSGTVRGENLALIPTRRSSPGRLLNYGEVADWAVESWLDSPGHKENMFTSFTVTGIGVYVTGDYYYITQIFEGTVPYAVPNFGG